MLLCGKSLFLSLPVLMLSWLSLEEASAFYVATGSRIGTLHHSTTNNNRVPFSSPRCLACLATVSTQEDTFHLKNYGRKDLILETIASVADEAKEYADMFGLSHTEAAFYGVFRAIRNAEIPLGLKGEPFVLRRNDIMKALNVEVPPFDDFFTMEDFSKAVEDDFLDAVRGSTDNRKGWKITNVSTPRGETFEEARMTFEEVQAALDKGTVILNAAGAHIPKLAGSSLACTDATSLPNAINLYVTAAGKRTSAPPHTDKQDVVVVQTSGRKHWRVFNPPDSSLKPMSDIFTRGKGDDNLPLHALQSDNSPDSSELLLETTLAAGDILFVPAAFPHTTSTADVNDETSVHLTFNIDTHIWELDYLSARRLALKRACVQDTALGQMKDEDNRYEGKCNKLPRDVKKELFDALPLGLLDYDEAAAQLETKSAAELERISKLVDTETAAAVDSEVWRETIARVRQQGMELFDIHRDMYLAALKEGKTREAENAMTAHLEDSMKPKAMTPERMQRLSLFRVKSYYEQIDASKAALREWSYLGTPSSGATKKQLVSEKSILPENWAFTLPVKVGDQVEADLGGALFDATVTRVANEKYDVRFFDGDIETGLDRQMIKLKVPPSMGDDAVDTSNMTPKQLKRWKKQQEKKNKKV